MFYKKLLYRIAPITSCRLSHALRRPFSSLQLSALKPLKPSDETHLSPPNKLTYDTRTQTRFSSSLPLSSAPFSLSPDFISSFSTQRVPFGFNGLGEFVFRRTYSRIRPDGRNEEWFQTVERVVNGTFAMQQEWAEQINIPFDREQARKEAEEMYRLMFEMKFLPPGRGLWAMGTSLTRERKLYAALNNCGFVSTQGFSSSLEPSKPFCFLMDCSMLGIGVGFDTKGADGVVLKRPSQEKKTFVVWDSREGWVEALRRLVDCYYLELPAPEFDFSMVRPAGEVIHGFGGVTSGPAPLSEMLVSVRKVLDAHIGKSLSVTGIVDIMNYIGKCVVSGNVRRTAEIAFGDPLLPEYLDLKDYSKNPQRAEFGWTSNNSVFAELGGDYSAVCERVALNGEPGFAWLDNMRAYGRMQDPPNYKDSKAMGGNPCLEQTLESYELCCLVETFPARHQTLAEFQHTLRYAFLYAKTVTLGQTHWPEINQVLLRNRRIGCSMSGVAQFITSQGLDSLKEWCENGYETVQQADTEFSDRFKVPRSIKTTSIKPSGTVSLLAGSTPGMHYPKSRFYIRRVRVSSNSELLPPMEAAGFKVEPAVGQEDTMIVEIPVDCGEGIRTLNEVGMWEQLSLAAFLQKYWADNQVSCTVTFDPVTEGGQLKSAVEYFQYQLKGVSFLPQLEDGAYAQMPYEEISQKEYEERMAKIDPEFSLRESTRDQQDFVPDRFCDSSSCEI